MLEQSQILQRLVGQFRVTEKSYEDADENPAPVRGNVEEKTVVIPGGKERNVSAAIPKRVKNRSVPVPHKLTETPHA
jgi:hypothetical protein